jgi:phosphatidyl-N-methylethanolamine N-methyltransferase
MLVIISCFLIALSSALYSFIWFNPIKYRTLVAPTDPCIAMSTTAHILKLLQFLLIAATIDFKGALHLPLSQLCVAAVLLLIGQHLNYLCYKLLGVTGIYYGSRFGKHVKWVSDYPYSVLRDPQYLGGIISNVALAFIAPIEIPLFWIANYFYLMYLESSVPS